jgi:hypothetical protein
MQLFSLRNLESSVSYSPLLYWGIRLRAIGLRGRIVAVVYGAIGTPALPFSALRVFFRLSIKFLASLFEVIVGFFCQGRRLRSSRSA